jgi:alcohol dehydrogenase
MRAVVFEESLAYREDYPEPDLAPDWALVRVATAGICQTDIELTRGYMGFRGVLGHEFVGRVVRCSRGEWMGRRVVAEINNGCGKCSRCREGLGRHCDQRSVMGIVSQEGCMADFCAVPSRNLVAVPGSLTDDAAVLIEPLAAACEILEQVTVTSEHRVVVIFMPRWIWPPATRTFRWNALSQPAFPSKRPSKPSPRSSAASRSRY